MNTQRNLRIAPHAHGQTAIFDDVGLVCTMEAGSQSKRDRDAAYIVGLSAECQRLREALADVLREIEYCVDDGSLCRDAVDNSIKIKAARAALQEKKL